MLYCSENVVLHCSKATLNWSSMWSIYLFSLWINRDRGTRQDQQKGEIMDWLAPKEERGIHISVADGQKNQDMA